MIFASALLLAASAGDLTDQYSREWQTCVADTSRLWATKPGRPETIVDMAFINCRKKMELYFISQEQKNKEMGLNQAQSDEFIAILGAGLMSIIRSFAINAVETARGSK